MRSIGGCCERRTAQPLKNTAGATVGTAAGDPAGWQWWVGREDGEGVGSGHAEVEEERGCLWELSVGAQRWTLLRGRNLRQLQWCG